MRSIFAASLVLVLALAPAARAQDRADERERGRSVALARFLEPIRAGEWEKAEAGYAELFAHYPETSEDPSILYRICDVRLRLGGAARRDAAAADLARILAKDPAHVPARLLLARLEATSSDPRRRELAKEHLLIAARHGASVMHEVFSDPEVASTFAWLKSEPRFLLAAMRASQDVRADATRVRNPFQSPWHRLLPPDRPERTTPEERLRIEARVSELFKELDAAAERDAIDDAVAKLAEIERLLAEYGEREVAGAREKLERLEARLGRARETTLELKLRVWWAAGTRLLARMDGLLRDEKLDDVDAARASLATLCERMRREKERAIDEAAFVLAARGDAFAAEAAKRRRVKALEIVVTGIVIDPRPDSRDRAIVNGRVVEVGDAVTDRDERDLGLRVVAIREGVVRFRFEDVELTRSLKND